MASEDYANYRTQAPTIFALIGSNEPGSAGLHFPDLIVKDETIPTAVEFFVNSSLPMLDYFNSEKRNY